MPNLKSFKQQNSNNHHRSVIVVCGDRTFCLTQLEKFVEKDCDTWVLATEQINLAHSRSKLINPKQANHYLGRQCQQLIIDAHQGLDLNAFGALTGCVVAGGSCIILTPEFANWPILSDAQNKRFDAFNTQAIEQKAQPQANSNPLTVHLINVISQSNDIAIINRQTAHIPDVLTQSGNVFKHPDYHSQEQQIAVEKIIKVATGHRNRPLVLTADRGRGKSSALGLAASKLIKAGKSNIIISAPQRSSIEPVFARLSEQLSNEFSAHIQFVAIDCLIADKPKASLLLIDEAAAIGAPLLTELVSHYSRIVLTSTITGYEGTGRSFEIRFKHKLTELKPQWQQYHMQTPIRFALNDPLESLTNRALMLDAQAATIDKGFKVTELEYQLHNRASLVANTRKLTQIVGLLAMAHYKTSPNDIRHILNGNNIDIHTLSCQQQIIAVAMVAKEGAFTSDVSEQIAQGQRRPKGHLLPLSLSAHSGLITAPNYLYGRIVRIAVHPTIQQQGLGSELMTQMQNHYQHQGFDFLGSSFGANQQLLSFWLKQQFTTVRIGLTVEASSNEYAALVLKALKSDRQSFIEQGAKRFRAQFLMQIKEYNPLICPYVVMMLLAKSNTLSSQLSQQQAQDLEYYLKFNREYEFCSHSLQTWILHTLCDNPTKLLKLPPQSAALLIDKLLKQKSWQQIIHEQSFDGKKSAVKTLKQLISQLHL